MNQTKSKKGNREVLTGVLTVYSSRRFLLSRLVTLPYAIRQNPVRPKSFKTFKKLVHFWCLCQTFSEITVIFKFLAMVLHQFRFEGHIPSVNLKYSTFTMSHVLTEKDLRYSCSPPTKFGPLIGSTTFVPRLKHIPDDSLLVNAGR